MSEAILAFHSQLSVVMETVLKAAMFEITRLVEVSFLEEVMQSRQEVEALKQRLQQSERRLMAREGDGRGQCEACGRAAVHRQEGPQPGVEDGCDVKEEKHTEGNHSSCIWEVPDATPPGLSQEVAMPTRTPDVGAAEIITVDLEEDRTDSLHSTEDLKETTCGDGDSLQGQPRQHQEEAGEAVSCEADMWDLGLLGQQRDRWGAWGAPCRLEPRPQHMALALHPTGPQPSAGMSGFERAGPRDSASGVAQGKSESRSGPEHGGIDAVSSPGEGVWVKVEAGLTECGALKQEVEVFSACRTLVGPATAHPGEEREKIAPAGLPHAATPEDLPSLALHHEECPHGLPGRGAVSLDAPDETECDLGDVSLAAPGNAESHVGEPAGERSFSCLHCGKSFSQLRNLKDHQRYHTGNKTHSCVHCGKGFVYMCHLKVHLQSHTGERPYSCTQCGKTFTYLCNLKSHQQYHTGEKPYSCTQCGKSFRHLSHLKKHRFMHTGERPYRCTDCGKRFAANGDLKRHQRIHTR